MTAHNTSLHRHWRSLDKKISTWWDADLGTSREDQIRDPRHNQIWFSDESHEQQEQHSQEPTLLYLPFPYLTGGGSENTFPEMYCWDIYFTNLGLACHNRFDIIRNHIFNQLFMIDRYGVALNGNRTYYLVRSQTPLHPSSVRLYYEHKQDRDLVIRAYPTLKAEYLGYWKAPHHHIEKTGLATNRDLGELDLDPNDPSPQIHGLRPELAAEAEILDFTAIFEGDVRKCHSIQINCALVQYAKTLAWMADLLGWSEDAVFWQQEAEERSKAIQSLCWDDDHGFFFDYHHVRGERLPYWSLGAYWTLWAGLATREQAERLVEHLERFLTPYGATQTDTVYPSPHPEFDVLQWDHPNGWPPSHIILFEGLRAYGYGDIANELATRFLTLQLRMYDETGKLWEKYNVAEGNLNCPRERYPVVPLHGWSSATVVYLGHHLFSSATQNHAETPFAS
jgi:alpha,alpha-trehalase